MIIYYHAEMSNQITNLNAIIHDYLRFVFSVDLDDDVVNWRDKVSRLELDEYLNSEFRFSATDNWEEGGFDIANWYEGSGNYMCGHQGAISDILDFQSVCQVICYIECRYDDSDHLTKMGYAYLTPEMVIRHYARAYLHDMSLDELRGILLA